MASSTAYRDFIELEYKLFSEISDEKNVLELIKSGIAKNLRDYAESRNYEITESELLRIICNPDNVEIYRRFIRMTVKNVMPS